MSLSRRSMFSPDTESGQRPLQLIAAAYRAGRRPIRGIPRQMFKMLAATDAFILINRHASSPAWMSSFCSAALTKHGYRSGRYISAVLMASAQEQGASWSRSITNGRIWFTCSALPAMVCMIISIVTASLLSCQQS